MKKNLIAAFLMGAASLSLLSGCGDDDKREETAVKIYKSIDDCRVDNSENDCQQGFNGAAQAHMSSAPHIPTREECAAKYGIDACVSHRDTTTGNEWFVPAMTGFMIGHMVGNLGAPVYIDRSGMAYSGTTHLGNWRSSCDNSYNCRSGGFVSVPPGSNYTWHRNYSTTTITTTTLPGKPATAIVAPSSRGGFGSAASGAASGYSSSVGKAAPSAPSSSIASPGVSSARGGFGGSASSSASAGG